MTLIQALWGFSVLAALLTITPGLDTALVVRSTVSNGRAIGFFTAAGIFVGTLTWGVVAAVGGAALLATSQLAYRLVSLAGALYIVGLGVSMIAGTFRSPGKNSMPAPAASPRPSKAFVSGLLTNLLNPKIGVFYVATIPLFIPAGYSAFGMGLLLASVHVLIGAVWLGSLILATNWARRWLQSQRSHNIVDRVTGCALIVAGGALGWQQRVA